MNALGHKSKTFDLFRDGETIVIAGRDGQAVDSIVPGIILDLVFFPFLSVFFIMGIWMVVSVFTEQLDNVAALMGFFFAGFSALMFHLILKAQPRFFPHECRFRKDEKGEWMVERKVWFVSFRWRKLGPDWTIWCCPGYFRGDWGYTLYIHTPKTKFLLSSSGAWAASESMAKAEGLKDLAVLTDVFQVSGELRRLHPWKMTLELDQRIMPSQTFSEDPQTMAALGRRPQPRRFHFVWSKARFRQELKTVPAGLAFIGVMVAMTVVPSVVAGTIAAIFFLLAIASVIYDSRLGRGGCRTQGIVVGHRPAVGGGGVFPLIEFRDRDGNIRREETRLGNSVEKPSVGSRVTVVYDPKGRRGCEIDRFWRRWGFAMILCFFGAVFAYVAFG
jgi:hypothetical protein